VENLKISQIYALQRKKNSQNQMKNAKSQGKCDAYRIRGHTSKDCLTRNDYKKDQKIGRNQAFESKNKEKLLNMVGPGLILKRG
jgi:hypothetical protein